jgi:hypothetical protein
MGFGINRWSGSRALQDAHPDPYWLIEEYYIPGASYKFLVIQSLWNLGGKRVVNYPY